MLALCNNRGVRAELAADAGRAVLPPDVVWIARRHIGADHIDQNNIIKVLTIVF